MTTVNYQ